MTVLRRWKSCGSEVVRLVECPFCGDEIEGANRTRHLQSCDDAQREVSYQ